MQIMRLLTLAITFTALLFTGCYKDEINPRKVNLSVSVECIYEEAGDNATTHTYLCKGTLSGFSGKCSVAVEEQNLTEHRCDLQVSGDKTPFEFTFKSSYDNSLGAEPVTFNIVVYDRYSNILCQTTTVAIKR